MIDRHEGDCRDILQMLPPQKVNCCITSPPYWGLRSYLPENHPQKQLEIGQESSPHEYVDTLVGIFREVARVLTNDGTLWLNLGDKHAEKRIKPREKDLFGVERSAVHVPIRPHELMGLPWRVAFAMQNDGWKLHSDIIWHKPNPKPDSIKTRPTRAHEYLFLFSKRERYYYDIDATREPVTSSGGASFGKQRHSTNDTGAQSRRLKSAADRSHPLGKNKRSVWKIPVRSFPGAHFAVMPAELVMPCVLAGCPKGGTVLDPFAGRGTTGVVAEALGRHAVLVELNPIYTQMQMQRQTIRSILRECQGSLST